MITSDTAEPVAFKVVDFVAGLFGRRRVRLGEWPHGQVVEAAMDTLQEFGAELYRESGTPAGELDVFHFRAHGRRMRLCVEDYGAVTLWGPKRLVTDVAHCVADRLAHAQAGAHVSSEAEE